MLSSNILMYATEDGLFKIEAICENDIFYMDIVEMQTFM